MRRGVSNASPGSRHFISRNRFCRSSRDKLSIVGESDTPLEIMKYSMPSTSANFCELRVSEVTGEIRVDRLVGTFDCGRILDARPATSRFRQMMFFGPPNTILHFHQAVLST